MTYYVFVNGTYKGKENSLIYARCMVLDDVYGDGKKAVISTDRFGKNIIEKISRTAKEPYGPVMLVRKGKKYAMTADGTLIEYKNGKGMWYDEQGHIERVF